MNRRQQTDLRKTLREQGYRARIEQRGRAWRAIVSLNLQIAEPSELLSVRAQRRWHRTHDQLPVVAPSRLWSSQLVDWLKHNGWPFARLVRESAGQAVIELQHDFNFWQLMAQNADQD